MSPTRVPALSIIILSLALSASAQPQEGSEPVQQVDPSDLEETDRNSSATEIRELRRRIDLLAAELEHLRSGESSEHDLTEQRRQQLGLAPSAASTYSRVSTGVSFAGYGEMLLENFQNGDRSDAQRAPTTRFDFLRAVLYTGYRFNDKFIFNSEIEVEHANEISVEFAYIDYLVGDHLTLRAGMVLLPLGLTNEFHEPTVSAGARRPETEQRILPTTWRENGAGVIGTAGILNFRAYVTNGLRGTGFSVAGLRGGRQKGSRALASNLAFSGRLDITPAPGIVAGIGLYNGGSGQAQVVLDGTHLDVGTTVIDVHGQLQLRGLDLRGLLARATIKEAGRVSRALGLSIGSPIAEAMQGGYIYAGYNLLSQFNAPLSLTPYVRYERVDTQHRVPAGFTRDLSRDGVFTTVGVEVKPIPDVALKVDYQLVANEANTGRNQFNVNLGYAF
jgi:hypothetical protein